MPRHCSLNTIIALLVSTCFAGQPLLGQQDAAIAQLIDEAEGLYREKDFPQSLERYSEAIQRGASDSTTAFNAACCAALTGKTDLAFSFLEKAITFGWLDLRQLEGDTDLNSLHADPRWSETVAKLKAVIRLNKKRWNDQAFSTRYAENLSDAEKASGLSKVWAEVKYNFVNFHLVPELDWDAEYVSFMPKVLASQSTLDYYRLLEQLVAKLKDGHTNVYLPSKLASEFNARPALRTRLIEGRVIVVKILDSRLSNAGIQVGQEVVTIDGQAVRDYAEQVIQPYMTASTPQDLATRTYEHSLFRGPISDKLTLGLLSLDGKPLTMHVSRSATSRIARFFQSSIAPLSIEILDGNIAHVRLTSFGTTAAAKAFARAFEKIEKADGLILDLRENGGGNSGVGWTILGYLTDKPFPTTRWHTLQYRPVYRAWDRQSLTEFGSATGAFNRIAEQHYQKPVSLLIGPRTFSAAEDMAAAFDMLKRGKIIGQPSGGSTGQPLSFPLPGGGRARVCTRHDAYADGTEFVGKGIQPDILVDPKVQDVINGFDRALEVARRELLK